MRLHEYSHRSGSFDDMMVIGNQLSKSERLYIFGTDRPKDWTDYGGKVVYREIYYHGTTPVGFVVAYEYDKKEPGCAYVVIAVIESERERRGSGSLATTMLQDCVKAFSTDPMLQRYSYNAINDIDIDKSPWLMRTVGFVDVAHRDSYDPKRQRVMELPKAGSESTLRDPIVACRTTPYHSESSVAPVTTSKVSSTLCRRRNSISSVHSRSTGSSRRSRTFAILLRLKTAMSWASSTATVSRMI